LPIAHCLSPSDSDRYDYKQDFAKSIVLKRGLQTDAYRTTFVND